VYGLAGGWSYTVTESDRAGFAQVGTDLTGAIAAGETVNAKVVNTYSASGKLEGAKVLKGEKVLTGRSWNGTDKFTFLLEAPEGSVGVPMPEGAIGGRATVELTELRLVLRFRLTLATLRIPSRACIPMRFVNRKHSAY